MKKALKIFWETASKRGGFIIFGVIASYFFYSGNKDTAIIYWIFACTNLIIAEIKEN